jgi:DNA-binding NtrC family response regulator
MKARVLLFEDDPIIRPALRQILEKRGCEVKSFSDPGECPLLSSHECRCRERQMCADFIISDIDMYTTSGLKFIDSQKRKGCRIPNLALMSGSWTDGDKDFAERLNCKTFQKPFDLPEMMAWIEEGRKRIDADRRLSDWFLADRREPEDA